MRLQTVNIFKENKKLIKSLSVSENVFTRNSDRGSHWIPHIILSQTISVSVLQTLDGHIIQRHHGHLKGHYTNETVNSDVTLDCVDTTSTPTLVSSQATVHNPVQQAAPQPVNPPAAL